MNVDVFTLITKVGAPVAGALVMGFFIFLVLKQILEGIIDQISFLKCLKIEQEWVVMSL